MDESRVLALSKQQNLSLIREATKLESEAEILREIANAIRYGNAEAIDHIAYRLGLKAEELRKKAVG